MTRTVMLFDALLLPGILEGNYGGVDTSYVANFDSLLEALHEKLGIVAINLSKIALARWGLRFYRFSQGSARVQED